MYNRDIFVWDTADTHRGDLGALSRKLFLKLEKKCLVLSLYKTQNAVLIEIKLKGLLLYWRDLIKDNIVDFHSLLIVLSYKYSVN